MPDRIKKKRLDLRPQRIPASNSEISLDLFNYFGEYYALSQRRIQDF